MSADEFHAVPEIVIIDGQGMAPETFSPHANQSAVYSHQQPQVHMPVKTRKNGAHGLRKSTPLPQFVPFGTHNLEQTVNTLSVLKQDQLGRITLLPAPRHQHTDQLHRPQCPLRSHQLLKTLNPVQVERRRHIQPELGTQSLTYSSGTDTAPIQGDNKRPRPHDRMRAAAFFYTDPRDQGTPEIRITDGSGVAQEASPPHTDQPPAHYHQQPQVQQQSLERKNEAHGLRTSVPLPQLVSFRTNSLDRPVPALSAPTQDQRGLIDKTPKLHHTDQVPRTHSPLRSHQLLSIPNPAQAKRRQHIQPEHGMQFLTHSLRPDHVSEQREKRPRLSCHITAAPPLVTDKPTPKASQLDATTTTNSDPTTRRHWPPTQPRKDSSGLTPIGQVSAPLPGRYTSDSPLPSPINSRPHHITRTNNQAADRFLQDLADRTPVTDVIPHSVPPTTVLTRTSSKSITQRSRDTTRRAKSRATYSTKSPANTDLKDRMELPP